MTGPLVVVGDILLDREILGTVDRLCPEAPVPVLAERSVAERPGGAGLAALFAAAGSAGWTAAGSAGRRTGTRSAGREVLLVGAVGDDDAAARLRELLARCGVRLVELPLVGPTPEKIRLRSGERLLLRLDRGDGPSVVGQPSREAVAALRAAGALLVSDYGRGVASHPAVRRALAARGVDVPLVWDPHPRGGDPVPGADLVTPNLAEARGFLGRSGPVAEPALATGLRRRWGARAVAVTLGERGAVLAEAEGPPRAVPAPFAASGDPCGAGDRFAGTAVVELAAGAGTGEAVAAAVAAATRYVATRTAGGGEPVAAGGAVTVARQPIERMVRR